MSARPELERRLGSIEELLGKIEAAADPSVRTTVQELVEVVMALHGAGLERMIGILRSGADRGDAAIEKLAGDNLVSGLLVLHGIHPLNIRERVQRALDGIRSRLRSQGAEVELLTVDDGAIRLRLEVKSNGCSSTAQSLRGIVEEAVYQAAPDLTLLAIEGADEKQGFVPLEMLMGNHSVSVGKGGL